VDRQLPHRVLDQFRIAVILKTLGKSRQDASSLVDLSQQKTARVRSDVPAIKTSHHVPPPEGVKTK
jgi:hypothetical protein